MLVGISGKIGSGKDTVGGFLHYLYDYHKNDRTEEISFDNYQLYRRYGFNKSYCQIKKFATKLKQLVCILLDCHMADLEDHVFKNTPLGPEWDCWSHPYAGGMLFTSYSDAVEDLYQFNSFHGYNYDTDIIEYINMTPRRLLQLLGTDCGTQIIHPNLWVNGLLKDYSLTKIWVITDVRFVNEAEAILDKGGFLIRIEKELFYEFDVDNNQHIVYDIVNKQHNLSAFNADSYTKEQAIQEFKNIAWDKHSSETSLDNYKDFNVVITNDGSLEDLFEKVKAIYFKYLHFKL